MEFEQPPAAVAGLNVATVICISAPVLEVMAAVCAEVPVSRRVSLWKKSSVRCFV